MALGRRIVRGVVLGDGSMLVVGNDDPRCVRPDSVRSEIWTLTRGTWASGPSLNAPRAEFVAAAVAGGGVLVTGGVNAGVPTEEGGQDHHQSFSSTYVHDPGSGSPSWMRGGLLDRARTLPTAAPLNDGRVLVLGGYYLGGQSGGGTTSGVQLASYRAATSGTSRDGARPPADIEPPATAPTFATAELYDPRTGSWSATGPMRFARVSPSAVTLVDGRVLVVGSGGPESHWNYSVPRVDDRAFQSAEIYDPRSGRFVLTADLPAVDWSPLAKLGPYSIYAGNSMVGALVALDNGGALLVGHVTSWSIRELEMEGTVTRTLRLDPGTGRWALVDQVLQGSVTGDDRPGPVEEFVRGRSRRDALAVVLRDGRVLIAGGRNPSVTARVDLYDPLAGTWSIVPPMPEPRAGGAAVLLGDGSVLVVGGQGETQAGGSDEEPACGTTSTGLSSAIRFVAGP